MVAAAAIAVAAALAFAATTLDSGQDDQSGAAPGTALDSGASREEGAAAPGTTLVGEVAGTPASVAQDLQENGFDTSVEDGSVIVRAQGEELDRLERAVDGLEPGPVAIYVR
jgi:hypothetical protein